MGDLGIDFPRATAFRSSNVADMHVPLCTIPQSCYKVGDKDPQYCPPDDFQCICTKSNSIANNTLFDQNCMSEACSGNVALKDLLESLVYGCQKSDRRLVDIPKRWEALMPGWANEEHQPIPTGLTPGPESPPLPHGHGPKLGVGPIAGIVLGSLAVFMFIVFFALLFFRRNISFPSRPKHDPEPADSHELDEPCIGFRYPTTPSPPNRSRQQLSATEFFIEEERQRRRESGETTTSWGNTLVGSPRSSRPAMSTTMDPVNEERNKSAEALFGPPTGSSVYTGRVETSDDSDGPEWVNGQFFPRRKKVERDERGFKKYDLIRSRNTAQKD